MPMLRPFQAPEVILQWCWGAQNIYIFKVLWEAGMRRPRVTNTLESTAQVRGLGTHLAAAGAFIRSCKCQGSGAGRVCFDLASENWGGCLPPESKMKVF